MCWVNEIYSHLGRTPYREEIEEDVSCAGETDDGGLCEGEIAELQRSMMGTTEEG